MWTCALTLNSTRTPVAGSEDALVEGIRRGGDLRIGTEFLHNEHIDVTSSSAERVREVAEFGITYLVEGRWVAGIMSLRQPVELPTGFGRPPSMSFFLYNQDGRQAIGRPHLDGIPGPNAPGPSPPSPPPDMPKYHTHDSWDDQTNAPSSNFTYDFDTFKYYVSSGWEEVLCHDADGRPTSGSVDTLIAAFSDGRAVKVGITDLCSDLAPARSAVEHEVFVEAGSCYCYLEQKLFIAGSHPVVRIQAGIPMHYESRNWDFGWLVLRTDGVVVYRRCDPYTLDFEDVQMQRAIRWFVR
ncbi:MAG: hypothetical protein HN742_02680 [Lentisphaerae bacterium]|jgi:hypothetical protein|nr:hypothetical protein [Lentisphaerota bacterium]MBT5607507.1 hypothetical protein [Lentisphaerota bacterium]MBT7058211.1 hypothetical protein [Lentisphaerota bacterium]MBT7840744.1 hypothetical protein [Lentisphaerota bacterium]